MSLAFLYPLIWIAAGAAVVPIWLHLRRKDDPNLVRFSAMRFLEDQPVARIRPLWPRDWPLLLLRLLALLLLVSAFAWPYLRSVNQAAVIKESRVFILDNTLSNQAGEQFAKARDKLAKTAFSNREVQVAVVELASTPRVVVGFGDEPSDARQRLHRLHPSHQRGSYLDAFRVADELLQQSLGEQHQIILVGDSQQNQWLEGMQAPPFLDAKAKVEATQQNPLPNLSLHLPQVRRLFIGDRTIAICSAQLSYSGKFNSANLTFAAEGLPAQTREILLPTTGNSVLVAERREIDRGVPFCGSIAIDGDVDTLPADNRVFFSLPPLREGKVALLTNSQYLKTALSPEVMQGRWTATTPNLAGPSQPSLAGHDVLCLESRFLAYKTVRDAILDTLNDGRGVILFVDGQSLTEGFLRDLGIEMLDPHLRSEEGHFRYIFYEHPVLRAFRSTDFGNLADVSVNRYRRLQLQRASPLLFAADGTPIAFESAHARGKMLVFAFTTDRDDTNWPRHASFVPFVDKCLQHVRAEVSTVTDFHPAEVCIWNVVADGQEVAETVLRDDSDGTEVTRAQVTNGQARFAMPDKPGLYRLCHNQRTEAAAILSVNPDQEESRLTYDPSPDTLQAWQIEANNDPIPSAPVDQPGLELTRVEIQGQKVWWWTALIGLVAIAFETVWLAARQRAP